MSQNKQLADLEKLKHFSPAFDELFGAMRDTVQYNIDDGKISQARYGLGMRFYPVEEDVHTMPKIHLRRGKDEEDELMCLADVGECFGRIQSGGVFPTKFPDWMNVTVRHNIHSDDFSLNCTFFVPPFEESSNKEEARILGHTKSEHKSLAIASYAQRDLLMQAALSGDMHEYKRHLMAALKEYGDRLSN